MQRVLFCCLLVQQGLSIPVNLYNDMTLEEKHFYFGDTQMEDIDSKYEIGVLKKKVKPENLLKKLVGSDTNENEYTFEAFNINVQLKLKKNDILVSPRASIAFVGENGYEQRKLVNPELLDCLMIHKDEKLIAALSNCKEGKFMGFISTPEDTFEITPLTERLKNMLFLLRNPDFISGGGDADMIINDHYIVKRATFPNFTINDSTDLDDWNEGDDSELEIELFETDSPGPAAPKTIEMAIFFDHVAYSRFSVLYSDEEIEELLLAYVNQVHALYHVPSLGQQVDITIIYLEIQKTAMFENHNGEYTELLDKFCKYNNNKNPEDDQGNPRHWDVGVLLSGLDIWGKINGLNFYEILGLARTGGMCHPEYSCLAVELGVWSALGHSYPTTGFSAAYTLAHELGHSLGMKHDGKNNDCEETGFIMSPKRGPRGQTQWSSCSGEKLLTSEKLTCLHDRPSPGVKWDHNNTMGVPGHFIGAEEQCKFYFHNADKAEVASDPGDADFCSALKCRNGDKVEETGPPLEGTSCGTESSSWCKEGECTSVRAARWSLTRKGSCRSGCLAKSSGYQEVDRVCLVLEGFEDQNCDGAEKWVELCDDSHLCGTRSCASQRRSRTDAATLSCEKHAQFLPQINENNPVGKPAKHSVDRPWQACSIHCQVKNEKGWISPRGAHFPDGTWCHHDGEQDYYCRNHLCLPNDYADSSTFP